MTRETHTLEPRYFERMAASLGDKMKIIEALPPVTETHSPTVLDVGAGGGEFAHVLEELGYTVTALDASDDAIMRMREKFPNLTTVRMLADESARLGENIFDAVVCSSILHEVYSYGDSAHKKGDIGSLYAALAAFRKILKPGGVLVIRDGVKPTNWDQKAKLRMVPEGNTEPVRLYLEQCPFANGFIKGATGRMVALRRGPDDWYTGNVQSVFEFYMTYNWGLDSYPRETQELFGILTLNQYVSTLEQIGFEVTSAESWVQPGYLEHLPKKVELITHAGYNVWPDTNALWVARKP
jgi:SAM-dependent methyltransferase